MTEKAFLSMKEAVKLLGIGCSTMQREAAGQGCPVIRRAPKGPLYFNPAKLLAR